VVSVGLRKEAPTVEANTFSRQIRGYSLATAQILYRMPDHPAILQSYVWQEYDLPPYFPELHRFLEFWGRSLDGALHTVMVVHAELLKPIDIRWGSEWQLH
jgi:uncharacterized protein Usg